jgi:hypothetical protein
MKKIISLKTTFTFFTWTLLAFSLVQVMQVFIYSLSGPLIFILLSALIMALCISVCTRICEVYKYLHFLILNLLFILLLILFAYGYQKIIRLNNDPIVLAPYIAAGICSVFIGSLLFFLIRRRHEA